MLRSERDERETVRATILFEIVASGFIKPFLPFPLFLLFENWILLKRYAFYISFHFLGQNSRISSGNHNLRLILSSLIKNIILVQLSSREERKVTFFLSGKNRGERKKRREGRNWRGNLFPFQRNARVTFERNPWPQKEEEYTPGWNPRKARCDAFLLLRVSRSRSPPYPFSFERARNKEEREREREGM